MVLRDGALDSCEAPGRWAGVFAALVALALAGAAAAEDLERTHRRARTPLLALRQGGRLSVSAVRRAGHRPGARRAVRALHRNLLLFDP